jgi:nitrogen regulation protein NR(I)
MDKLLLIDDEADVQYSFRRILDPNQIRITTASSGEEGLKLIPQTQPDLVIMDIRLGGMNGLETLRRLRQMEPKLPVIMMTAYGTTQTAIEAMKWGAYDYLLKPFDVPKLKEILFKALKVARDMKQVVTYQSPLPIEDQALGIIGRCDAMQEVFKLIGQLSLSDATVLITGESGTGKELVARAIYHHSKRSQQPYLAINCAAIPENLLESELFGHERGAFTGAVSLRIGKFEQCHQGTLFLDEIGDMSPSTQTRILRVLQSGEFERVGGNQTIRVDVRVIAATNRGLEQAVANKQFREDLFYRLNVVRIHLPPLRERPGDLRSLIDYFLRKHARRHSLPAKSIADESVNALERYPWPGNVRELENAIQRALVITKTDLIQIHDLPPEVTRTAQLVGAPASPDPAARTVPSPPLAPAEPAPVPELDAIARALYEWARQDSELKILPAVERCLIIHALQETKGNQVRAARLLGITRATLRKRIEKFGIKSELHVK